MPGGSSLGHGLDDPDLGPVVSENQQRDIERYLEIADSEGTLLVGAELPDDDELRSGYFVRPHIVTEVTNSAQVAREEVFGPLLTVIPFDGVDDALAQANDSDFGLVAGVFTSDVGTAMRCAESLDAGQVWINTFGVGLDVEFPFGGYKRSGFGREKGLEAIGAYCQIKNICVGY